jgi:hypothetical protein
MNIWRNFLAALADLARFRRPLSALTAGTSPQQRSQAMFRTDMNEGCEWTKGLLRDLDVDALEAFDSAMKTCFQTQQGAFDDLKAHERLAEEQAERTIRCEHGILLHEKCRMCRAILR